MATTDTPLPESIPELRDRIRAHLAAAGSLLERLGSLRLTAIGQTEGRPRTELVVAVCAWADVCKASDLVATAEELVK